MKRIYFILAIVMGLISLNAGEIPGKTASNPVIRMGVIGDSVSVPYATQPWKGAGPAPRNWLELLVDARNVSVGEWKPSQPDREGAGYSWVWANGIDLISNNFTGFLHTDAAAFAGSIVPVFASASIG